MCVFKISGVQRHLKHRLGSRFKSSVYKKIWQNFVYNICKDTCFNIKRKCNYLGIIFRRFLDE